MWVRPAVERQALPDAVLDEEFFVELFLELLEDLLEDLPPLRPIATIVNATTDTIIIAPLIILFLSSWGRELKSPHVAKEKQIGSIKKFRAIP